MTTLSPDERRELGQSVRSACERLASEDRVRAIAYREDGTARSGFDTALWDVLCNQVGIAAIALPEHLGGAGYGATALGVVAHELGRVLAPVPFISSTVLATGLLLDLTEREADAEKRFTELSEGRRTAEAALTGDGGMWRRSGVTLTAAGSGTEWVVDGTVRHVMGGTAADDLVVVATAADDGALAVFLLDTAADGVTAEAERVLDGTRPMATFTLSSAPAVRLSGNGPVDAIVERNVDLALAVLSAEQVGACERLLEIACDYARTREQFGKPIGSFQAIKHKCADMLVDLEWAQSASQAALQAAEDTGTIRDELSWRTSMAKAVCSEALRDAASANLQIHGGIGFTWEDSAQLYFKRARTDEVVLGGPGQHWDRLALEAKLM